MGKMMKFKCVGGYRGKGGAMTSGGASVVAKDGIVESDLPLDKMFVNAYTRVDAKGRTFVEEEEHHGDLVSSEERDEAMAELQTGGEVEAKPKKKAPAKAKAAKPKADKEDEWDRPDGMKDVTEDFKKAKDNDLTVEKSKEGFAVKDGDKTVSTKPLKTKKQVEAFLASHLDEDDSDDE